MASEDERLALVLQASRDFAKDMLEKGRGFTPFGTRVRLDGEIEFFGFAAEGEQPDLEAAFLRTRSALAESAGKGEILAAAVTAIVRPPAELASPYPEAICVALETPQSCRNVYAPFRLARGAGGRPAVEFGRMIPAEGTRAIFAA